MKIRLKLGVLIFTAILLIAGMVYTGIGCTRLYKTEKLIQAITSENTELVNLLLAEGVDPNRTDIPASWLWSLLETSPKRPLAVACKTGNLEIVKLLIDYGATAEPIDGTGFSPLRETLFYYHPDDVEIVTILLENGAQQNGQYEADLVFAAAQMIPKVYDKQKENGTVFAGGYDETSAQGITEIVSMLLGNRSVNITTTSGQTLLMISVQRQNLYLVEYLLAAGAETSVVDANGKTVYDYAIATNNEDIISIISMA